MSEVKRGPGTGKSRLCFVCLGNICRSPTAEAVMRHLVAQAGLDDRIEIESAGTGDWHVGEPRDRRSRQVGERRGIPLGGRARQFVPSDFARFDHVLAMDAKNLTDLCAMAPDEAARQKVRLLRSYDPASAADADVPDPYYGGADGFDDVFDVCQSACAGLLEVVRRELDGGEAGGGGRG
jgi:protein-tyrosine phosphatase